MPEYPKYQPKYSFWSIYYSFGGIAYDAGLSVSVGFEVSNPKQLLSSTAKQQKSSVVVSAARVQHLSRWVRTSWDPCTDKTDTAQA